jgi:excisionase family DNA binding protein
MIKMLTTAEAAAELGKSLRTVQAHIERGNLEATMYGRDYLIEPAELERFKRERRGRGRPKGVKTDARRTRRILLASSRRMARRAFQVYWRER